MMNLALILLSMSAAQARERVYYLAICQNGDVSERYWSLSDGDAINIGKYVCENKFRSNLRFVDRELNLTHLQDIQEDESLARMERELAKKRKEEELAKKRKEEEKACEAKKTEFVTSWVCPNGALEIQKDSCNSGGNHRVKPELYAQPWRSGPYFPEGETCAGPRNLTSEIEVWNAEALKHPAYEEKRNQAYHEWRIAEDAAEAKATYDCLAGVCLNAPATHIADKLVTISEVVMHRTVEVCSGRVVSVEVSAGWVLPTFEFATIAGGAEFETDGDGMEIYSTAHAEQISKELEVMGWVLDFEYDLPGYYSNKGYVIPTKRGWRDIMRIQGEDHYSWRVDLETVHPDKDALCAPKRQQGL